MSTNTLSLHKIQKEFLGNIYPLLKSPLTPLFQRGGYIHHNNIFINLTKALSSVYPSVEKIVGKDFFTAMAAHYIQQYPSKVNSLNDYGQQFAEFLATFPQAAELPYLAELAQLEWGCHKILNAPDDMLSNLQNLSLVPAQQYDQIKFKLTTANCSFDFQYPIYRIWQLCQQPEENDEVINLEEGGVKLLVVRIQFALKFYVLSAGEFALLNALINQQTIGQACARAIAAEPDFAVNNALNKYIMHGIIVNYLL